jgi:peptide subunit release factor 1 (eRF1)
MEAGDAGREVWYSSQMEVGQTQVTHASGPCLAPLVRILDEGWPLGVVVVALERVRVLEWALGRFEELDGWELETTALDWRERKAPQRNTGADGTGTSSSGREQHMQRLEHNRERFLKDAGHLIATNYGNRDWRRIIVFGDGDRPQLLAKGLGDRQSLVHKVRADLIRATAADIADRVAGELEHLNREREEDLVNRVEEAVGAEHAALGPEDVLRALEEGRVRHLIFTAERDLGSHDGTSLSERLIELALTTSADVTPVEGRAAEAVQARGGVIALLRY